MLKRSIKKLSLAIPVIALFYTPTAFSACYSSKAKSQCRYPSGDSWCRSKYSNKKYAYSDSCLKKKKSYQSSSSKKTYSKKTSRKRWQEGDSAYVYASSGMYDLQRYANVSIEQINYNNNRAKVYVNQICWNTISTPSCSNSRSEGGFTTGQYKWVSTYSLESYPSRW